MQGGGLESLIPKRSNSDEGREDQDRDIEFPLPDVSSGGGPASRGMDLTSPKPMEVTLPEQPAVEPKESPSPQGSRQGDHIFHIETDKIQPNPHQPRKHFDEDALRELANSIREFGILQPLVVSKIEKDTDTGRTVEYQLIAGERRLMASKMLGLPTVPAIVRQEAPEVEKLELAVIENIQRSDLNPIEQARAIARLQDDFGMTQREIATRLGKGRGTIANTVRLLSLPTQIQEAIETGQISESQGRILLSLENPELQQMVFEKAIDKNMTVRQMEAAVRRAKSGESESTNQDQESPSHDFEILALKEQLEEYLGTKVDVRREGKSGKIIISFFSKEELDSVVGKLFKQNGSQLS